jgi:predicted GNAT family acetyltransferase
MMQAAGDDPKDKKTVTESDLLAYAKSKLEKTEESFETVLSRFDKAADTVDEIYDSTIKLNKQLAGSGRYVEQIGKNFVDAANEILPFTEGVETLEKAIAFAAERAGEVQEATNRAYIATSQEIKGIVAAQQASGVESATLVKNFKESGYALSQIPKTMQKVIDTTRALGVNTEKTTKDVVTNIGKLNTFNFSNGVEGLTRMAAQAGILGIKMESVFQKAEELFDPERAVEMAASLQRLGVATGDLIDPLKLMDLGQNNPQELQNQIAEMSKRFTYFNEQNQKFEILPGAKRELREIAKEVGLNADELAKMALTSSDMAKKMSEIRFPTLEMPITEDQKSLIANMAEMRDGEYKIQVKETVVDKETGERRFTGKVEEKAVKELTSEDFKSLMKQQEEGSKSLEDIARENLTYSQRTANATEKAVSAFRGGTATQKLMNKSLESINKSTDKFNTSMSQLFSSEQIRDFDNETVDMFKAIASKFTEAQMDGSIDKNEVEQMKALVLEGEKKFKETFGKSNDVFKNMLEVLKNSPADLAEAIDAATKGGTTQTEKEKNKNPYEVEGQNLMQSIYNATQKGIDQSKVQPTTQTPNVTNQTNTTTQNTTNQTTNQSNTTNLNTTNFYEQIFNQITQTLPTALQGVKLPDMSLNLDPLKSVQEGQMKVAEQSLTELQKINTNLQSDNQTLISAINKTTPVTTTPTTATNISNSTTKNDNSIINNSQITNNDNKQNIVNNDNKQFTTNAEPTDKFGGDLTRELQNISGEFGKFYTKMTTDFEPKTYEGYDRQIQDLFTGLKNNINSTPTPNMGMASNIQTMLPPEEKFELKLPKIQVPELSMNVNSMTNMPNRLSEMVNTPTNNNVNYSGTLKIQVDVNAPDGVNKKMLDEALQKSFHADNLRKNIEENVFGGGIGKYNSTATLQG